MIVCKCGHPKEFHYPKRLAETAPGVVHGEKCVGGRCGCSGFRRGPV